MDSNPTRLDIPDLPAAAAPKHPVVLDEVIALIKSGVRDALSENPVVKEFAKAVAQELRSADPYPDAVVLDELGRDYVLVPPLPTEQGNMLVITQVAVKTGQNFCLAVLIKDLALLNQPRIEGAEMANYTLAIFFDEKQGDLRKRRHVDLDKIDPGLSVELVRQLRQLKIGAAAFFYLNVLQAKLETGNE